MPASIIQIDINTAQYIRALRDDRFIREPLRQALTQIGRHGENDSKMRAPVDFGRLRASITHQVDDQPLMMEVAIGVIGGKNEMKYAKYMEYGTGLVHDHPNWPRRPHNVRAGHLLNWGPVRRGIVGAGVAKYIRQRGGLRPRRYLRGMLEQNGDQYVRIIRAFMRKLVP